MVDTMTIAKTKVAALESGTLYDFLTSSSRSDILRSILTVLAGTALLWLSAKASVPFYPVPMTLQPLAVLLLGAALGPRLAGATVATYLLEGAAGLPVFAAGGGIAYLMGPTGGYLVGFLIAAIGVGALAQRGWDRNILTMALAMAIGVALIYLPGVLWLSKLFGWQVGFGKGLLPFLYGDALKIAIGALLMPAAWQIIRSRAK
jgi:biotin transport system substrate-specific component